MPSNADQVECFVFDACALIAYLNDEPGAEKVEDLLDQAQQNRAQLHMAAVNVYEVFYDCLKRDAATARQLVDDVYGLPITIVESLDRQLMDAAGWFKVSYRVSLADSLALGLAQLLNACLVSTDHRELDPLDRDGKMRFHWLR
jgi:PIN domain nuclease of toxin-antitoxin system